MTECCLICLFGNNRQEFHMKKFTADCINSNVAIILEVEYEIIQVDNASTVGCQVQFFSDERILFLEAEESFGKENNLGVLHAKDSIS